jgi:hypothetical protein
MTRAARAMIRRRIAFTRVAAIALLSVLAAALVPRDARYAHTHADDQHGHVHAWDGTRLGGSTSPVRDLVHGEHHDHGDTHGHVHGVHEHAHGREHRHGDGHAQHARVRDHSLAAGPPHAHEHEHHHEDARGTHDAATPSAYADAAEHERDEHEHGDGIRAAAHGASHVHWQSPFQIAAAAAPPSPIVLAVRWTAVAAPPLASPQVRARDWRARAPPFSV